MKSQPVKIYSTDGQRTIGLIKGDVFEKKVRLSKHLFWKLDAWGVDAATFENVLKPQNKRIRVIDTEEGVTYETDSETMATYGKEQHFKGYSRQIFLPRRYWTVKDKVEPERVEAKQAALI